MKKLPLALLLSLTSLSFATTQTTLTYQGFDGTSACATPYSVLVYIPDGVGPFPVYVHTVGTGAPYNGVEAPDMLANMSARGYIAASVEYPSLNGAGSYDCSSITSKTQCMYDTGSANSAISKVCALAQADCSSGILVSGMSQGAQFATLANNFDAGVKAAYAISDGDTTYGSGASDFTGCMDAGNRTLPADRLRAVSGESDIYFGNSGATDPSTIRTTLQRLTGLSCTPTSFSCFRGDGSGWYEIQDNETTGNFASHCYELGDCLSSTPTAQWIPPSTLTWAMLPNLDWLSTYLPIHPTTAFSAGLTTITVGQSTTLTWTTSFATAVSIDQGLGARATNSSVVVSPSATTTYTLTAMGSGNGTTVKTVTITVNAGGPVAGAPAITKQPQNASTAAGASATFSVTATGTGPLAYQWQMEAPGGSFFADIPGATSASYTTPTLSASDSGTSYQAIISNGSGAVASAAVTVTVGGGSTIVPMTNALVFPNPWRQTSGVSFITFNNVPAGGTVKLFTLSGRWIKTLPVSGSSVTWDMTNDSGNHVASGMYFYLVSDIQGNKTKGKLTVIR